MKEADVVGYIPTKITAVNLYSNGTRLFSWQFVGSGSGDAKVQSAVFRLRAVAETKQLPGAVVQVVGISRQIGTLKQGKKLLTTKASVSVLHEDGKTWIDLDADAVLSSEFRDDKVFEQVP